MREVKRTVELQLAVGDEVTDGEVDEALGKFLAGPLVGAAAEAHGWQLVSARLTDVLLSLGQLTAGWRRQADRSDRSAVTAREGGNTTLAVQRAEGAYWLGHCAGQLGDVLDGTLRLKRRPEKAGG